MKSRHYIARKNSKFSGDLITVELLPRFKGILIDFKYPIVLVDLQQVYLWELTFIYYLESSDQALISKC